MNDSKTKEEWTNRIYSDIMSKTFFKDELYNKDVLDGLSIYEPGDLIQDLSLDLQNDTIPYGLIGIWDAPVSNKIKDELNTLQEEQEIIFIIHLNREELKA